MTKDHGPDRTDHAAVLDECSSFADWCKREGYDPVSRRYHRLDRGIEDREDEL